MAIIKVWFMNETEEMGLVSALSSGFLFKYKSDNNKLSDPIRLRNDALVKNFLP